MSDGWGRTKDPTSALPSSYSVQAPTKGYGRYLQAMMKGAGAISSQGQVDQIKRFTDARSERAPWTTRRR